VEGWGKLLADAAAVVIGLLLTLEYGD